MPKKRINKRASPKKGRGKIIKLFQNNYSYYFAILLTFIIIIILIMPSLWRDKGFEITGLVIFQTNDRSGFDEGTYEDIIYDSDENLLKLGLHNQSGSYISKVFDAGNLSSWNNLTWTESLPSKEKIFVVDANSDIWVSDDSEIWTLLKDDYTGSSENGATYMIYNDDDFFIIFNQDIWSSTDFGYTWTKVNDNYNEGEGQNAKVAITDSDNNLYIIEGDEDVWKSTDSGTTWNKIATNFNGGNGDVKSLVKDSSNTLITVDGAADVWGSLNGENWTLLKDNYNDGEFNNPGYMIVDNNDDLFIIEKDDDIWKSTDSGTTWNKINDDYNGEGQHVKVAITDSDNNLYIIEGDEDVWKSTDSGTTWNKITTNFNGGNGDAKGIAITTITTDLQFRVRSDNDDSNWSDFIGQDGTSDTYYTDSIETLSVDNNRYFQYKAYFTSDDGISIPKLSDIIIRYEFIDTIPPASITGLNESLTGTEWIYWNWTNPPDSDFSHTEVWLDDIFKINTTNNFYNATGLDSNTTYEIQTRTSDTSGNVNLDWVNNTVTTDKAVEISPQVLALIPAAGSTFFISDIIEISANVTNDINISSVMANITYPNGTINQLVLNLVVGDNYNNSFTAPSLKGMYNITFTATDISNNINSTEKTGFTIQDVPVEEGVATSGGGSSGGGGGSGGGGSTEEEFLPISESETKLSDVTVPNQEPESQESGSDEILEEEVTAANELKEEQNFFLNTWNRIKELFNSEVTLANEKTPTGATAGTTQKIPFGKIILVFAVLVCLIVSYIFLNKKKPLLVKKVKDALQNYLKNLRSEKLLPKENNKSLPKENNKSPPEEKELDVPYPPNTQLYRYTNTRK